MSGNESYDASEGGARKRIKTSKTGSRAVSHGPASPIVIPSDTPLKPASGPSNCGVPIPKIEQTQQQQQQQHGGHVHDEHCHHEQSLRALHTDMDAMRHLITCKMCYRFLYEPYGLNCGHTYCYSCLAQWMCNSKTCPDCRAKVKEQPTPTFLVREMVRVFVAKDELLPDGETKEEHAKMAKEEAELVAKDRANEDVALGGLFRGRFRKGSRFHPVNAFRDESDNVWRCPACMNEVEDGRCGQCNLRVHTDGQDDESEDTDTDDLSSELDGSLEDMDHDGDVDLGLDGSNFGADGFGDYRLTFNEAGDDLSIEIPDYYESEDSGDDLSGFVDDDVHYEDDATIDGSEDEAQTTPAQPSASQQRRRQRTAVVVSDSGSDSDNVEETTDSRRVVPTRWRPDEASSGGASRDSEDSADESDDEPIVSNTQRNRRPAGRQRPIAIDSDDEEAEDRDQQPPDDEPQVDLSRYQAAFSPSSDHTSASDTSSDAESYAQVRQMNAAARYGAPEDEDDDDDDDDDVPASSRQTAARHAYDLDGDEEEEEQEEAEEDEGEEEEENCSEDHDDDDSEAGHSMTNGWAPSSSSPDPKRPFFANLFLPDSTSDRYAYTHRLHTLQPRRHRHRSPPPDHSSYYPQGNPRVQPTYRTSRIPADVVARAAATARGATALEPIHPFQLSSTLARLNAERRQLDHGDGADSEDEAEIAQYVSGSRSSGSSRTFDDEDSAHTSRAGLDGRSRR